ncbi:exo-beta-N-acetylmuramidase NamZ family protein [Flavobacterium muglaense]|uniref:DUF1343 domain-containing protein n=1 Tax=Flavobacterium muglaense TaxID=2764716 RepID=A0A923N0K8_9FLAO|nr:DUF1343 domain-containing protein [Flavobacterium muglaense]MBC5838575.1 DUF1343 domain-containing protein [Flavobacterium muglaense]MBC5845109.1 DUF1343 domain-containing protein [Flavobacterium muglaense]
MILFLKKLSVATIALIFPVACSSAINNGAAITKPNVTSTPHLDIIKTTPKPAATLPLKTGADNYESYLPLLEGKKTGVVTNQSGLLSNNVHLVDFLLSKNISLQKIFAPEHGFRGTADAGEHIVDGKDSKTGLSIISLYGDNKKPKASQLTGIDIMVFDLQDVGARFYTYISSLHYIMEACAENNIPLLILDRPNPNGNIIDGPILDKTYTSFVGMHPIPLLHGMTIGEYAKMINGERWLKNGTQCNLTVISCTNYSHSLPYDLPVKPSPNLPNAQAVNLYASLCLFEGTNVSVGRGTEQQFQIYGSPYLPKEGYSFTPKPNLGAQNPLYNGTVCYGEDLTAFAKVTQLELKWLIQAYKHTTDKAKFFNSFFTKLAGTEKLQEQIENNIPESTIRASWKAGLNEFKQTRAKYLLYN